FKKRLRDAMHGGVDELSAIAVGNDFCIWRKNAAVEGLHLNVDAFKNLRGVGTPEQEDDSRHGVGIEVLAEDAAAFEGSQLEGAEILHENGSTVFREDYDVAEVLKRADQADAADDIALLAADDDAAAGIGVVGLDGSDDLGERHVVLRELGRLDNQLELRGFP